MSIMSDAVQSDVCSVNYSAAADECMQCINIKCREVECYISKKYVLKAGVLVATLVTLVLVYWSKVIKWKRMRLTGYVKRRKNKNIPQHRLN
jgi:hypothetical protein